MWLFLTIILTSIPLKTNRAHCSKRRDFLTIGSSQNHQEAYIAVTSHTVQRFEPYLEGDTQTVGAGRVVGELVPVNITPKVAPFCECARQTVNVLWDKMLTLRMQPRHFRLFVTTMDQTWFNEHESTRVFSKKLVTFLIYVQSLIECLHNSDDQL